MEKLQFFSIGVYGRSSKDFFDLLTAKKIDTFVDVRNRRAVRGSKYAFVNSERLQNQLTAMDINYLHVIDLAPTKEIRGIQKKADEELKIRNPERENLTQGFVKSYKEIILDKFNLDTFVDSLRKKKATNVVLFCVEHSHEACHRSIVANEIEKKLGLKSIHL
jgi:uncharacterized protein (DUF488 family)